MKHIMIPNFGIGCLKNNFEYKGTPVYEKNYMYYSFVIVYMYSKLCKRKL